MAHPDGRFSIIDRASALVKLPNGRFLSPERVEALRKAFIETMKDKELLAEAEKTALEVNPVSGEEIQRIVLDAYQTPPDIVKRTGDLLKGPM